MRQQERDSQARKLLFGAISLLAWIASTSGAAQEAPDQALIQARKEAAWHPRRIMYNDDGCHVQPFTTPEELVALRLRQLIDTQVDTICYCTGGGGLFWGHQPQVGELVGEFVSDSDGQYVKDICSSLSALKQQGTDPLAVAVRFGHDHKMEVFWSYRMNNIEDSFANWGLSRWKREHPQYLFGKAEDYAKYDATDPRKWWAGLDYAAPEVRDYTLRIIEDVCTRYDIDGVDMDWFRAPRFFRETNEDQPATPEHVAMMNDMMRKVRAAVDRIAVRRGRPVLISGRVPLSVERCLAIGLDVPTWLDEGLVDMLVFGGDLGPMAMAPQLQSMVALAHSHRVPALANICASGLQEAHGYSTLEAWWAAGTNAWHVGVDGIYVFNVFPPERDERFSRLGSPETLEGLEKLYAIDCIRPEALFGFDRAGIVVPDRLPILIGPGQSITAKLPVGEDIVANAPQGQHAQARLRVRLAALAEGDRVIITLNGAEIGPAQACEALSATPTAHWLEVDVPPASIRAGENLVGVTLATSRALDAPIAIDRIELPVRYAGPDAK